VLLHHFLKRGGVGAASLTCLVLLSTVLISCSQRPRVDDSVDPRTGLLQSVVVWVPRSDFHDGTPYFMIQSPSGSSTYWDAAQTKPDGNYVQTTLTLRGNQYRPAVGDSVWVYAINRVSGKEDQIGILKVVSSVPNVLTNGDFAIWPSGNIETTAPVGWRITQRGTSRIDRIGDAGMRLVASPSKGGSSVAITQNIDYAGGVFRARIRPAQSCSVSGGKVREFFGFIISDDRGQTAMFCVGNQKREMLQEVSALQVVDVLPGRAGSWTEIAIDPNSPVLAPYARFTFGKEHPLSIGVEADANGSRAASGDAAGIRLEGKEL
jgi:hypothetical protein